MVHLPKDDIEMIETRVLGHRGKEVQVEICVQALHLEIDHTLVRGPAKINGQ